MKKDWIEHKKKKESNRKKAKSCKPNNDGVVIDPISQPNTTIKTSMSGIYKKGQWEKIFGKKNNKKRTDKKT